VAADRLGMIESKRQCESNSGLSDSVAFEFYDMAAFRAASCALKLFLTSSLAIAETVLQGGLLVAKSGRLEQGDNIYGHCVKLTTLSGVSYASLYEQTHSRLCCNLFIS